MKLYWRYKKADGKYTWKPAKVLLYGPQIVVDNMEEEE